MCARRPLPASSSPKLTEPLALALPCERSQVDKDEVIRSMMHELVELRQVSQLSSRV